MCYGVSLATDRKLNWGGSFPESNGDDLVKHAVLVTLLLSLTNCCCFWPPHAMPKLMAL